MAWRQHGGRCEQYYAWAYVGDGERRQIALGTPSKAIARELERMLAILRTRREWRLIRAATVEGVITLGQLYDTYKLGEDALAKLEVSLDDVDLNAYIDAWQRWVADKANPLQRERYLQRLRALIPADRPFLRSQFTKRNISQALTAIHGTGSTKRRYHTAWSSFGKYLEEIEVLEYSPTRAVKPPRENNPRESHLELADVQRLVAAQAEPFRTLAALREGAGVEISAALTVRRRDVNDAASRILIRGTKNQWRTRPVYLEPWARPYIVAHMKNMLPDAQLFDGLEYYEVLKAHRAALKATKLPRTYTLHDARHSLAVRWMRQGINPNVIAANLGHKHSALVLRVYGKHRPHSADFDLLDAKLGDSSSDSVEPQPQVQSA